MWYGCGCRHLKHEGWQTRGLEDGLSWAVKWMEGKGARPGIVFWEEGHHISLPLLPLVPLVFSLVVHAHISSLLEIL